MKNNILHLSLLLLAFFVNTIQIHSQYVTDSLRISPTAEQAAEQKKEDIIVEYEITDAGDTVFHYKRKPFDFGVIYNGAPKRIYNEESGPMHRSVAVRKAMMATVQGASSLDFGKDIGKIPFTEGMTPSGGKTYSIPITTDPVSSFVPKISIAYNSQSGNGVAGYGWNLAGSSAITVTGKTIHYDGITAPVDLSKPGECVFALDGARLVNNTGSLTAYQYETAQGFVLVKKHLYGANVAYFTVAYPNGSTATFGFTNNTDMKYVYPITEMTDIKGYKINFDYIESGNNYYLTKVSYGGKTTTTHQAEILFNYVDRTDFTTAYISALPISANKLLKSVVSRNKVNGAWQELCTYRLTHELNDVQRLTQIDCASGSSSLNPLRFSYGHYYDHQSGQLTREYSQFLSSYFSSSSAANPVYVRGKFIKNKFGDGLITFPGTFSTYTKTGERVKKFLGIVTGRYEIYGSGYPADQNILIAPGLSFFSNTQTIKTEEGFQTIQAVDVNGDGVDEIVKVNFNGTNQGNTILKITTYTHSGASFSSQSFNVSVIGEVNNRNETWSPMSRLYFFGDFKGTGKAQLLTVTHNKAFTGQDMTSYFALIDLDSKEKISETTLFAVSPDDGSNILTIDMDGDGKTELCHATTSGLDVYSLMGNFFQKQYTTTSVNKKQFGASSILGDINGDGKIDILLLPETSYTHYEYRELPVWAPHTCPYCGGHEPIYDIRDPNCIHCHRKVLEALYTATCRECGNELELHEEDNPNSIEIYSCPTHGYNIISKIDLGYVDNGNTWTAYLSTGKGFLSSTMSIVNTEYDEQYFLMDINGDGNADMLRVKNNQVNLFLNKNGVIQPTLAGAVTIPSGTKILPSNVCDYYSMSHFIAIEDAEVNCYRFTKDNRKAHLLTTLTDSYGNKYTNGYSDMTELSGNYYATNTYRSYPYCSFIAPLNLLQSSEIYTGSNIPVKRYYYSYYGAVMHRTGLGFGGFEKVVTNENVENIMVEETRDPQLFGVTTMVDSPYKTISYSYSQDYFSNKKNNPRLIYTSETDKLTHVYSYASYEYDAYNNPTKVTTHLGSPALRTTTAQTYDNLVTSGRYLIGQPVTKTVTNVRGGTSWVNKETVAYNANRLPETRISYIQDNKVNETRWTYDAYGNITSELSAPYDVATFLGTTFTYDAEGRNLATSTNALGQTTTYANYDKFGHAGTVTDFKHRTTSYQYDAWGQLISTQHPDGTKEEVKKDWGGQGLYTVTNTATGKPSAIVHYDALGREIRKGNLRFDGQWQFVDKTYDRRGRLEKVSLPFRGTSPNFWATYTYDPYNRPLILTEASGKTTTWAYDGLSTTETRNGIATTKTTDESGALIKVEDPGGTIEYTLRPDGQPSHITAPGNVVTSFEYDQYGRQTSITDPSAGRQIFTETYAADGSKTLTVTDARNVSNTTIYDQYGRVVEKRADTNTSYVYNDDGTLAQLYSDNHSMRVFEYDEMDRVAAVWDNLSEGKFLEKRFNYHDGNIAEISYTSQTGAIATEKYVYSNGYNTEIKLNDDISIWKLTEENALGLPSKAVTGSLVRTYAYNEFGMPTGRAAGNIQNFAYDFDVQTGNLNSRTDNIRHLTETFGYDNLNRLSSIGQQQITYAPNGNITQMPGMGSMQYNHADRPYQVTMLTPDGNTVPLRSQTVAYNSIQRPDEISENGIKTSLTYNADGDRIKMIVDSGGSTLLTRYYFDNKYEIDGVKANAAQRLYIGGDAYSAPAVYVKEENSSEWKIYYICRDYLGSITHVANADGTLKQELSYDAWGRLRNPETQVAYAPGTEPALFLGRGYTGHEHLPQFGLINMNARLYDPVLGRFLSPDPYVQTPDFTQSFNRYSYCLNNPLVYVDQDGELFWFIPVIIGAVIGAYTGASIQSGTAAFWNWKSDAWNGAIAGAIVGATIGYGIAGAIEATGMTTLAANGATVVTKSAGLVSSMLNSGTINIAMNAFSSGGWDGAWKAGIVGLATGAWATTGGFGMVKGFGAASRLGKLAGKLGYQMIGTVSQSIGNNWASNKGLFSRVTLGLGPINLTLGKGQRLLQWENNLGNIAINAFGLVNTVAGGKVHFNTDNLTFEYTGGLMDTFQPTLSMHDDQLYEVSAGFSPHTVTGNSNLGIVLKHELHHLWHSRALNDLFLANYGLQGLNALILKGNFVANKNYYEDFVNNYSWWPTR